MKPDNGECFEAEFEIPFEEEKDAVKVIQVIGKKDESKKTMMSVKREGKKVEIEIKAVDFSSLRAKSTTLLRDLKAVLDTLSLIRKEATESLKKKADSI
ncbi:hypothetical protein HY991_01505 [Candidatus Micrarchaeota archaeon]|nr:hypothetical protein [Candidatus Micrarchaeota archaeon]